MPKIISLIREDKVPDYSAKQSEWETNMRSPKYGAVSFVRGNNEYAGTLYAKNAQGIKVGSFHLSSGTIRSYLY